jgi:hypothetical protein
MGDPLNPRHFSCPITGSLCVEPDCKRDVLCIERQRETTAELEGQERARQWRIRHGKATLDDLDL